MPSSFLLGPVFIMLDHVLTATSKHLEKAADTFFSSVLRIGTLTNVFGFLSVFFVLILFFHLRGTHCKHARKSVVIRIKVVEGVIACCKRAVSIIAAGCYHW